MSNIFGANWWTTLWGFITLIAGAIAVKPEILAFLPDNWEATISGVAGFIAFIAGGVFSVGVKDKNVTGGTVQQTADGAIARAGTSTSVVDTKAAQDK